MILRPRFFLIVTALVVAAPAFAETKSGEASGDDLICKTEKVVGSNIPKRVCITRAARDAQKREADEAMRDREQGQRTQSRNGLE